MNNIKRSILRLAAAASLSLAALAAQAEVVVVVSSQSPAGELSAQQVSDIFLGRASNFPGGGQAVPVDLPESAPARAEFYSKVVGRTAAQMKAHWSQQIFTGRGQPPKEVAPGEIRQLLASNPNIIGYMDKADVDGSVKVVLTP